MILFKIKLMMILSASIIKKANLRRLIQQINLQKVLFNSSLIKIFKREVLWFQNIYFFKKQEINVIL